MEKRRAAIAATVRSQVLTPLALVSDSTAERWLAQTPRNVGFDAQSVDRIASIVAAVAAEHRAHGAAIREAAALDAAEEAALAACVRSCVAATVRSEVGLRDVLRTARAADAPPIRCGSNTVASRRLLQWVGRASAANCDRAEELSLVADAAERVRRASHLHGMLSLAEALRILIDCVQAAIARIKASGSKEWESDAEELIEVHHRAAESDDGRSAEELLRHGFDRVLKVCESASADASSAARTLRFLDEVEMEDENAPSLSAPASPTERHHSAETQLTLPDAAMAEERAKAGEVEGETSSTNVDAGAAISGGAGGAAAGSSETAASNASGAGSSRLMDIVFGAGKLGIYFKRSHEDRAMVHAIDPSLGRSQQQWNLKVGSIVTKVHGISVEELGFRAVLKRIENASRPVLVQFRIPTAAAAASEFDPLAQQRHSGGSTFSPGEDGDPAFADGLRRSESQVDLERTQEEARRRTHEKAAKDAAILVRCGVPPTERIVTSYTCALYRQNFPVQGLLHLTHNYAAFIPNASLEFISGLKSEPVVIHLARISAVDKAFAAVLLPNAIQIETESVMSASASSSTFVVFLSSTQRDRAYDRLCLLRGVVLKLVEAGLTEIPVSGDLGSDDASYMMDSEDGSTAMDALDDGGSTAAAVTFPRKKQTSSSSGGGRWNLINPASGLMLEVAPDGRVYAAAANGLPTQVWQRQCLMNLHQKSSLLRRKAATTSMSLSGRKKVVLDPDTAMSKFEVLVRVRLKSTAEAVFEHIFKGGSIEQQMCDLEKCRELEFGEWTAEGSTTLKRKVTFEKPVVGQTAHVRKMQTLRSGWEGRRCILSAVVTASGPMFTDTFVVHQRTVASECDPGVCDLVLGYRIEFIKSTWMESFIKRTSRSETLASLQRWKTCAIATAAQHYVIPPRTAAAEGEEPAGGGRPAKQLEPRESSASSEAPLPSPVLAGAPPPKAAATAVALPLSVVDRTTAPPRSLGGWTWSSVFYLAVHIVFALLIVNLYKRERD